MSAESAVRSAEHDPMYYVLSAGRTGTMFLETLVKTHCPDVSIEHEPSPSRYLMMLGNLRNDFHLMSGVTRRMATRHQANVHAGPSHHIEVNPFLCAVTDLLPHPTRPLRIVHMVRSPGAWAQSMTTFKASTKYRHVIDYVPFAKPFPAPRPMGWRGLSPFEKSLHRWNWCNKRIAALKDVAEAYTVVRSEDLFSGDAALRENAVTRMVSVLNLTLPDGLTDGDFGQRVNPSPDGVDLRDAEAERRICGAVAAGFGYDL
jgi:hypothetical protein